MRLEEVKTSEEETPLQYFQGKIECLVELGMTYTEAVVEFCEIEGIEQESVVPLVKMSGKIKEAIAQEAEEIGILKKTSRLPL